MMNINERCEYMYAACLPPFGDIWYVEKFCQHPDHWVPNLQVDRPLYFTEDEAQERANELNNETAK